MSDSRLYNQLDRIETKVERLDTRLDGVDISLTKYNSELETHIKRTEQIESQLLPLVQTRQQISGAVKLAGALISLAALLESLRWLWGK